MSQTDGDPDGPSFQNEECQSLLSKIHTLLDYLQSKNDDRLQAHFDDTRLPLAATMAPVAKTPCKRYADLLMRLSGIERDGLSTEPRGDPSIDDITFLRWSLDFLATLAAPANVETISMTRAYIETRAKWANESWWQWLKRFFRWLFSGAKDAPDRRRSAERHYRSRARWLARSAARLEWLTFALILITVVLSTYAMVGHLIIDNGNRALARFLQTTTAIDADRNRLVESVGLMNELKFEQIYPPNPDNPQSGCPISFQWGALSDNQSGGGAVQVVAGAAASDPGGALRRPELALHLIATCRAAQWAQTALMTGYVGLRSWESPAIRISQMFPQLPGLAALVSWDKTTIDEAGAMLNTGTCARLANAYGYVWASASDPNPAKNAAPGAKVLSADTGCARVLEAAAQDSSSLASAILVLVGVSILPCLYAVIGAAAATMLYLGRQTDRSLLSYTDRGRIKYNLLLGLVFGAIIALVAGYLPSPAEAGAAQPAGLGSLGLSALAFLAGYNVAAMLRFLDALSRRIFDAPDPETRRARAAEQ